MAAYGHLVTPRKLAFSGIYLFSGAITAFAFARKFLPGHDFPVPCRIRNAPVFRNFEHNLADDRAGRHARSRDGCLVAVFGAMIPLGSLEAGAVAHFCGTPFALSSGATICLGAAIITFRVVIGRREAAAARQESCGIVPPRRV